MPDSSFQDDARENEMRQLFNLMKNENEGRSGIDACLEMNGVIYPFELKTTSKHSVTTVRDFGPEHIKKWQDKHWLIGFHQSGNIYYKYGSPEKMAPWIKEKEQYVASDFALADIIQAKITLEDLFTIVGEKKVYHLTDAKKIQKRQYNKEKYKSLADLGTGYSPNRMLEILADRSRYIINRGSTLNNPKIPKKYLENFPIIQDNHPARLRELVEAELSKRS